MRRRSGGSVMTVAPARQAGDDAVLETEDETRLGTQVEQPRPWPGSRDPAQKDGILEAVDDNLDPSRLSGASNCRRDVDGALLEGRGTTDGERLAYVGTHIGASAYLRRDHGLAPKVPPCSRSVGGIECLCERTTRMAGRRKWPSAARAPGPRGAHGETRAVRVARVALRAGRTQTYQPPQHVHARCPGRLGLWLVYRHE